MTRIKFILEQFELQSPGQQLLDRFLIGYNHEGAFRSSEASVALFMPGGNANGLIQKRIQELGLRLAPALDDALTDADAVIFAPGIKERTQQVRGGPSFLSLLEQTLNSRPRPSNNMSLVLGSLGVCPKINTPVWETSNAPSPELWYFTRSDSAVGSPSSVADSRSNDCAINMPCRTNSR